MSALAWFGVILGAVAIVGAVLHFTGLAGLVKVLRSITGALGDWASDVREWLKQPGNKTRGVCLVMGMVAIGAGLQSWQRGNVIVQQRADYARLEQDTAKEREAHQERVVVLRRLVDDRDEKIGVFVRLAADQQALIEQYKRENAQALADAQAARTKAQEDAAKFDRAYSDRTPACDDALKIMARACPALSDY